MIEVVIGIIYLAFLYWFLNRLLFKSGYTERHRATRERRSSEARHPWKTHRAEVERRRKERERRRASAEEERRA